MQEYSTPQNSLYFTFGRATEGGREGKGFPYLATNTEQNKLAFWYMQSTVSDIANLKLQILHEHLQHVQTSNSSRKGAALYTSSSCAPQPKHKSRGWFRSERHTCTCRVTDIFGPTTKKRSGNVLLITSELRFLSLPLFRSDLMWSFFLFLQSLK